MKLTIQSGSLVPKGYGRAYYLYNQDAAVYYLAPFHLIVRWLRVLYFALLSPRATDLEKMRYRIYQEGYDAGFSAGRIMKRSDILDAVHQILREMG
jgi:hypothetical protein